MARMECPPPIMPRSTARPFIEIVLTERCRKIIPVLCIGMIFFSASAFAADRAGALASELYAEGDWVGAQREAERALARGSDDETVRLIAADAALRMNPNRMEAIVALEQLAASSTNTATRSRAAYSAGRAQWALGNRAAAWNAYAIAFQYPENQAAFLRSGCAMFLLKREDESLGEDQPALLQQLATCRDLWNFDLRDEVRVTPVAKKKSRGFRPASGIVSFYRAQIAPAIGSRCSLEPSCSEYFLQASRTHGWLGIPMIGDRLIREPGVVSAALQPVERGTTTHYLDPVHDHNYWFHNEQRW